jgi:hypothetical protein
MNFAASAARRITVNLTTRRGVLVATLTALLVLLVGGCGPVTPRVEFTRSTFEGFDVVSYVPPDPVGLVYLFHGSNGSADFATRIETVDTLNDLIDRGYGFVATESTQRTGNRRWNVFDPSLDTNPDLSRLVRLQQHLIDTTPVSDTTPLVGLGMSNGARFVSLWGQTWADAAYPVQAIAMYMGTIAPPVEASGGLLVPTFFVTAENDFTSPPGPIISDHDATAALGTPTGLIVAEEATLDSARFLRIPDIDGDEADAIFDALVAAGTWDANGVRQVPIGEAVEQIGQVSLPPSVAPQRNEILDQCAIVLAVHRMRGDVKVPVADFFDSFL